MRKHLNPALVISLIALFVALGGSSYAAIKLPKNSVGNKQIKKNAVTSAKVKDRSLLATDFKAGQLPQGAKGDTGAAGATGATGARGPSDGYVGNRQASPLQALTSNSEPVAFSPQLPAGSYVVTGRANIIGGGVANEVVCSMGDDVVQSLDTNSGSVIPLTLSSGVKLDAPGTIRMFCRRGVADANVSIAQASIAAIRVESLTVQTTGN